MTAVRLGKGIWESCNSHYWPAILPWDLNHLILVTCGLCDPDKCFQLEVMHAVVRGLCIMSLMAPCDMMPFTLLTTNPMGGQMIHISPAVLACGDNTRRNLHIRPRNFCDPASSQHHNSGGGFTGIFFRHIRITAKCFSYPQTNLGARRSRHL